MEEGASGIEEMEERESVTSGRDDQYPAPGLRCLSRMATEFWIFRSSSRRVYILLSEVIPENLRSYFILCA